MWFLPALMGLLCPVSHPLAGWPTCVHIIADVTRAVPETPPLQRRGYKVVLQVMGTGREKLEAIFANTHTRACVYFIYAHPTGECNMIVRGPGKCSHIPEITVLP